MKELTKRQQDIIQASIKLISDGGIQHFTTKALAAELHVSEPAIYRHFEGKMDILHTILLKIQMENANFNNKMKNSDISINQLETMFNKHGDQFSSNPATAAIIFSEEIFQNDKRLSDLVLSIMNDRHILIYSIIDHEQKEGVVRDDVPAEQLTVIIMGTLRLLISRWRLTGYKSDLKKEMKDTWKSIERLLVI